MDAVETPRPEKTEAPQLHTTEQQPTQHHVKKGIAEGVKDFLNRWIKGGEERVARDPNAPKSSPTTQHHG